jgi:hypothetical protein
VSLIPELTLISPSVKITQLIILLCLALAFYCADLRLTSFKRILEVALALAPLKYLTAYLIIGLVSVAWSEDLYRTAFYAPLTISCLFAILFLLLSGNPTERHLIERSKKIVFLVIIGKLIASLSTWIPGTSILGHFHGVAAFESLVLVIFILCNKVRVRQLPMLVGLLLIIALSTSVKTYVSLLAFTATSLFLSVTYGKKIGILLCLSSLVVIGYLSLISLSDYSILGRLEHGSGRLAIYTHLLEKYTNGSLVEKIIGFGYVVGDKFEMENFIFYNAHNVFLSALVNLGVLGIGLQFLVFSSAIKPFITFRQIRNRKFAILGGGVVASFVNALANQSIAGPVSGPFMCTVILIVVLTLMINQKELGQQLTMQ